MLLSIGAGLLLAKAANQSLWEGVLALVAAVLVASLTVHMWRAGRHMKRDIEGRLEASSAQAGGAAFLGVFMFTLLMITREGMETALLMNALLFTVKSPQIVSGAIGGTVLAAFVAWLWSRYGHRVNLARFFQVTAVFLLVFVVQLVIYGFHELTEANIFPNSQPWHDATEPFGPDGVYGQYLTYLLVLLPLAGSLSRASSIEAGRTDRRRRRQGPGTLPSGPRCTRDRSHWVASQVRHPAQFDRIRIWSWRTLPRTSHRPSSSWSGSTTSYSRQPPAASALTLDSASVAGPSPMQALAFGARRLHGDGPRPHPPQGPLRPDGAEGGPHRPSDSARLPTASPRSISTSR